MSKLHVPSRATVALSVFAGVLAVANQLAYTAAWRTPITMALVWMAALGISPLLGERFRNALHVSRSLSVTLSLFAASLAAGVTALPLSADAKAFAGFVVTVFAGLLFGPAAMPKAARA